jgi:hypothetical protein
MHKEAKVYSCSFLAKFESAQLLLYSVLSWLFPRKTGHNDPGVDKRQDVMISVEAEH